MKNNISSTTTKSKTKEKTKTKKRIYNIKHSFDLIQYTHSKFNTNLNQVLPIQGWVEDMEIRKGIHTLIEQI